MFVVGVVDDIDVGWVCVFYSVIGLGCSFGVIKLDLMVFGGNLVVKYFYVLVLNVKLVLML